MGNIMKLGLDSKKSESLVEIDSTKDIKIPTICDCNLGNTQNTPTLFTQRLILRKFKRDDIQALYAIYSDKETNTYLPWFVCKNEKEAEEIYTQKYEQIYKQERGYHYAICLKEDNTPIGYVHLQTKEPYDLGYALCRGFWHKGYTREATRAIMQRALQDGIPYITATHDENNHRSGAVMRALGMRFCYAYKERWQPKDKEVIFHLYQYNTRDTIPIYQGYATEPIPILHRDSHNVQSSKDSQDSQGQSVADSKSRDSKNRESNNTQSKSNTEALGFGRDFNHCSGECAGGYLKSNIGSNAKSSVGSNIESNDYAHTGFSKNFKDTCNE